MSWLDSVYSAMLYYDSASRKQNVYSRIQYDYVRNDISI